MKKEIEKLIIPALKDELAIIDLARGIENASNSKIVISKLTARDNDYSGTVKAVNKHHQNKWKLIGHANINLKDLTKVDYTSTALLSLTAGSRQNKPATWVVSAGYFLVFCVFLRQIICSCTGADI